MARKKYDNGEERDRIEGKYGIPFYYNREERQRRNPRRSSRGRSNARIYILLADLLLIVIVFGIYSCVGR